ncbi:hypothetical protein K438DRAFT_1977777 [Mycena galopus ATCC 62051]|nr:hypothetical protein K438DRAFT_1977777 [Mycena galopus ATCC 62051]
MISVSRRKQIPAGVRAGDGILAGSAICVPSPRPAGVRTSRALEAAVGVDRFPDGLRFALAGEPTLSARGAVLELWDLTEGGPRLRPPEGGAAFAEGALAPGGRLGGLAESVSDDGADVIDIVNTCAKETGLSRERVMRSFVTHIDEVAGRRTGKWNLYQRYANISNANRRLELSRLDPDDVPGEDTEIDPIPPAVLARTYPLFLATNLDTAEEILSLHQQLMAGESDESLRERRGTFEAVYRVLETKSMKLHSNHGIAVAFVMVGSIVGEDHNLGDAFFTPGPARCMYLYSFTLRRRRLTNNYQLPAKLRTTVDDLIGTAKTVAYSAALEETLDDNKIVPASVPASAHAAVPAATTAPATASPSIGAPVRVKPSKRRKVHSSDPTVTITVPAGPLNANDDREEVRRLLVAMSMADVSMDVWYGLRRNKFMWTVAPGILAKNGYCIVNFSHSVRPMSQVDSQKGSNSWRIQDRDGLREANAAHMEPGYGMRIVKDYLPGQYIILGHDYSVPPPSQDLEAARRHWRRSTTAVNCLNIFGTLHVVPWDLDDPASLIAPLPAGAPASPASNAPTAPVPVPRRITSTRARLTSGKGKGKAKEEDDEEVDGSKEELESEDSLSPPPTKKVHIAVSSVQVGGGRQPSVTTRITRAQAATIATATTMTAATAATAVPAVPRKTTATASTAPAAPACKPATTATAPAVPAVPHKTTTTAATAPAAPAVTRKPANLAPHPSASSDNDDQPLIAKRRVKSVAIQSDEEDQPVPPPPRKPKQRVTIPEDCPRAMPPAALRRKYDIFYRCKL